MEAIPRGRGRLPGELKGKKYNVPKRTQITGNLLEKDLVTLDGLAQQNKITRSKLINGILSQYLTDVGL